MAEGRGVSVVGVCTVLVGPLKLICGISESGIKIADSIFWITLVFRVGFKGFNTSSGTGVGGFTEMAL